MKIYRNCPEGQIILLTIFLWPKHALAIVLSIFIDYTKRSKHTWETENTFPSGLINDYQNKKNKT